jgi:hypothetical protein
MCALQLFERVVSFRRSATWFESKLVSQKMLTGRRAGQKASSFSQLYAEHTQHRPPQ